MNCIIGMTSTYITPYRATLPYRVSQKSLCRNCTHVAARVTFF